MASIRDSGIAKPVDIAKDDDYGPFAALHQVAWGRRDFGLIFRDQTVRRDTPQAPQQTIKLLCWPQNNEDGDSLLELFHVSSVLVRRDYVRLLLDILRDVLVQPPELVSNDMDVDQAVELNDNILDYISRPKRRSAPNASVIGTPGIGAHDSPLLFVRLHFIRKEHVLAFRCCTSCSRRPSDHIPIPHRSSLLHIS